MRKITVFVLISVACLLVSSAALAQQRQKVFVADVKGLPIKRNLELTQVLKSELNRVGGVERVELPEWSQFVLQVTASETEKRGLSGILEGSLLRIEGKLVDRRDGSTAFSGFAETKNSPAGVVVSLKGAPRRAAIDLIRQIMKQQNWK